MTAPVAAKNAAFLVLASEYPNSNLVYSEGFIRALDVALEAAAPHMPRTITAREDLEALRGGAVILDQSGRAFQRKYGTWCGYEMGPYTFIGTMLPATVLYNPEDS